MNPNLLLKIRGLIFLHKQLIRNIVAATAEIIIHELEEAEFVRQFDEETGFRLFKIQ